jgi:hypothetical protein
MRHCVPRPEQTPHGGHHTASENDGGRRRKLGGHWRILAPAIVVTATCRGQQHHLGNEPCTLPFGAILANVARHGPPWFNFTDLAIESSGPLRGRPL